MRHLYKNKALLLALTLIQRHKVHSFMCLLSHGLSEFSFLIGRKTRVLCQNG